MVSTALTVKGYRLSKADMELKEQIALKNELSIMPAVAKGMPASMRPDPLVVWKETESYLYIPTAFGMERYGFPDEFLVDMGRGGKFDTFTTPLRPRQMEAVNAFIRHVEENQYMEEGEGGGEGRQICGASGIIYFFCGGGKTAMINYLLSYFKRCTLVVVHTNELKKQMKERVEAYNPGVKIGEIHKKIEVEGCDLVIAMLGTLKARQFPPGFFDQFGMMIIDECHIMAAKGNSEAFFKLSGIPIRLGVSATDHRPDDLDVAIHHWIGPVVYRNKKRDDPLVRIRPFFYKSSTPPPKRPAAAEEPTYMELIDMLLEDKERTTKMVEMLKYLVDEFPEAPEFADSAMAELRPYAAKSVTCAGCGRAASRGFPLLCCSQANPALNFCQTCVRRPKCTRCGETCRLWDKDGRFTRYHGKNQILILVTRTRMVELLVQGFGHQPNYSIGFLYGQSKVTRNLNLARTKQIVFATTHVASVGLDIGTLSTIFFTMPIVSAQEQSVGRALRNGEFGTPELKPGEKPPMVIDWVDSHYIFKGQYFRKRLPFYRECNFTVERNWWRGEDEPEFEDDDNLPTTSIYLGD